MKRLAALIPAAVALAAGVCCIPAVSASAVEVSLTPAQTRALFGNTISGSVRNPSTGEYDDITFTYLCNYEYTSQFAGTISSNYKFNLSGWKGIVYHTVPEALYTNSDLGSLYSCKVAPIIDLSNLTTLRFAMGYSMSSGQSSADYFYNGSYLGWYDNSHSELQIIRPAWSSKYSYQLGWKTNLLDPDNGDILKSDVWTSTYQFNRYQQADNFDFVMNGATGDAGLYQLGNVYGRYQVGGTYQGVLLFISCPLLNDDYVSNSPGDESSGGGSESSGGGSDVPDYSEQLNLILAKLDLIVNNDFNFDVNLDADLSGVESRLDGINSRLDGTNSRLDGSNSRVDGVNSRLDGVNSRLDNISGELHGLNSAPTETLPSTGGENSEFEHQAEMYMSDFRGEFEDSENQVFEVIDKGTGFLGFVRQFIIDSHLAQILPLVALLFIAHYVIFERGG